MKDKLILDYITSENTKVSGEDFYLDFKTISELKILSVRRVFDTVEVSLAGILHHEDYLEDFSIEIELLDLIAFAYGG